MSKTRFGPSINCSESNVTFAKAHSYVLLVRNEIIYSCEIIAAKNEIIAARLLE